MLCPIRIPDVLQNRIDKVAGKRGRSKWILDACRMRLDGGRSSAVEDVLGTHQNKAGETTTVAGSNPAPTTKPDMDALRAICAGDIPATVGVEAISGHTTRDRIVANLHRVASEIPICGHTWWENGEQWGCLMDSGHKESKHGMRGMVRKLDA